MEKVGRTDVILTWSRRIRWTVSLLVLAYFLACTYMWAMQRQYIFKPTVQLQTTPERLGLKFEEFHIPSGSGSAHGNLFAWWLPAENSDAPNMLYLHGNERNIGAAFELERAARLHAMGYNLLVFDYRGYGKSTGGEPSEDKVYQDAEAAWSFLVQQCGKAAKQTFIYGHSLGSAIAIELATHHPEASGVITESSFTDMVEMGKRDFPYLPVDQILNQRFDSMSKIGKLKIPLLLIHGTWDGRVPYQMSQQLFANAPQPKFIKLIEGGEHSNNDIIAPIEYRAAVTEFTQRYTVQH